MSPGAIVLGDGSILLRAERSGSGSGRVYVVRFRASNAVGSCSGSVRVGVPHNKHEPAVDDGQVYDSRN